MELTYGTKLIFLAMDYIILEYAILTLKNHSHFRMVNGKLVGKIDIIQYHHHG